MSKGESGLNLCLYMNRLPDRIADLLDDSTFPVTLTVLLPQSRLAGKRGAGAPPVAQHPCASEGQHAHAYGGLAYVVYLRTSTCHSDMDMALARSSQRQRVLAC